MAFVVINTSSNLATLVAAPTSPSYIRLQGYVLISGGVCNASFKSGTTFLTGFLPLTAQAGAVAPIDSGGWFDCPAGQALNIAQDNAQALGGHIVYEVRT